MMVTALLSVLVSIPRPSGRGLIEAWPARAPLQCRDRQFHDRAVVASLKHPRTAVKSCHASGIPRPRGRGLIEASDPGERRETRAGIPRPSVSGLIEAGHS